MNQRFVPARKGTILIPSGPTDHLHFICSDPVFYPYLAKECLLLVNISTVDPDLETDSACILQAGDHPFIRHNSYVYYRKADIFGVDSVSRNVAEGNFIAHAPCTDDIFQRILDGFAISEEVKPKIRSFYERYCI